MPDTPAAGPDPTALSSADLADRRQRLTLSVAALALLGAEIRSGLALGYTPRVGGWEIWVGPKYTRRVLVVVPTLAGVVDFLDRFGVTPGMRALPIDPARLGRELYAQLHGRIDWIECTDAQRQHFIRCTREALASVMEDSADV